MKVGDKVIVTSFCNYPAIITQIDPGPYYTVRFLKGDYKFGRYTAECLRKIAKPNEWLHEKI